MGFLDGENADIFSGVAQGIKGGIQGYMDMRRFQNEERKANADEEDRAYRRKEMAAKIKAAETEEGRKIDEQDIGLAKQGQRAKRDANNRIERDPVTGLPMITVDPSLVPPPSAKDKAIENYYNARTDESRKGLNRPPKQSPEVSEFKALPIENQEQIKKLAGTVSGQKAIRNALAGDLTILNDPNVSSEQKLVHAQSMIKTLNSKQGQDAVGMEESKRLASLLQFHVFNFTQPGPMFGRANIEEFTTQVNDMMRSLDAGIEMNNQEIDSLYGRQPRGGSNPAHGNGLIAPGNIKPMSRVKGPPGIPKAESEALLRKYGL
jgi:hypothetical protein